MNHELSINNSSSGNQLCIICKDGEEIKREMADHQSGRDVMSWVSSTQPPTESGEYLVYLGNHDEWNFHRTSNFDIETGTWDFDYTKQALKWMIAEFGDGYPQIVAWQPLPKSPYHHHTGAINQCPACKCFYVESYIKPLQTTGGPLYFIQCGTRSKDACGMKGPEEKSLEDAVLAWNDPCWRKLQQESPQHIC